MIWLLGVFEGAQSLIATVHARAPVSKTIGTWHDNFHRMLEASLQEEQRKLGVPERDLAHAARVASFVIEGLLAHPTSAKDRRGLIRWLIASARMAST